MRNSFFPLGSGRRKRRRWRLDGACEKSKAGGGDEGWGQQLLGLGLSGHQKGRFADSLGDAGCLGSCLGGRRSEKESGRSTEKMPHSRWSEKLMSPPLGFEAWRSPKSQDRHVNCSRLDGSPNRCHHVPTGLARVPQQFYSEGSGLRAQGGTE
jgi:hypothetical protein